jgi:hypothetical protein
MVSLDTIVTETLLFYVGAGARSYIFPSFDEEHNIYLLVSVDFWTTHYKPKIIAMVRIVGDQIIIEQDLTPGPLVELFLSKGIKRDQIRLIYDGESHPELAIPSGVHPEVAHPKLAS